MKTKEENKAEKEEKTDQIPLEASEGSNSTVTEFVETLGEHLDAWYIKILEPNTKCFNFFW